MLSNERGGILSKLFLLPIGVALMAGFFVLGYFVGKHQAKSGGPEQVLPPLPDMVSKHLPKKDEFTFYKTLIEKDSKTISVDLKKEKPSPEARQEGKKESAPQPQKEKTTQPPRPAHQADAKKEKPVAAPPKQPAEKAPPVAAKKESAPSLPADPKIRYTIQIASYQERGEAEEEVRRMKKRGYAAFHVTSEVPEKGTWYRVRVGSFTNKASAEKLAGELRAKEALSPFVTIE